MKMMFWVNVKVAAAMVTVAVASAALSAEQAAVQVWTSDPISDAQAGKPSAVLHPVSIVGARNGAFSGRVIVESTAAVKGLRASAGPLTMDGAEIPARNLRVRYAVSWDGSWKTYRPQGLDVLLESPPKEVPANKGRALSAVWVTVKVPRSAKPGLYKGSLSVEAAGLPALEVPIELQVAEWTLPDSQDWRTWVGMIQSPDSLALEYDVPLWSDQHWKLIAKSFERMSEVGCRNVFIPILCRTNFGNEESMVRWIKKAGGKYGYDFTIMDRYLDVAQEHLGKPKMVTFQVWEVYLAANSDKSLPFGNREAAKEGRQALKGKGPRVTLLDPKTGKTEVVYLPRFEDPGSKALWQPLFALLHKRMKSRGLEKTMMLGMISDVWPSKEDVAFLNEVSGGLPWASHAHPGRLGDKPVVGNKLLHKIADIGYEAHVYNLNYQVNPDKGRQYGWRKPQLEVRFARNGWPNQASFLQMRLLPAFNITGGQRGIGRIGADVWYVIKNNRGQRAGTAYHRYPEVGWRNLDIENWLLAPGPEGAVATARLENLREGIQECEARILIERALLDPAQKKRLGNQLAPQCQELLDERQRAMWKSIWSNEEELNSQGTVRARHPIEALWKALEKGGKKLPGYWDGDARKLRQDEAAQGRVWFAASGWQARNEKLFSLAGQVEKKAGIARTISPR